jgi:sulfur-oxidizing protein SoxY
VNRREALTLIGGVAVTLIPLPASSTDIAVAEAIRERFGERPPQQGRVTLKLPTLAESGNSVPVTVSVDSPMSPTDRVARLGIFANGNPRPRIATAIFGENAAGATFTTNIRLNGTQDVIAVAEMSDGALWMTQARILVTYGACDALQRRF